MMKWKKEIQAILFSLIGGARYGVKIRLPHAVVMTCLFRNDLNSSQKVKQIIRLVQEHASNLALFAALYKSILLILKYLSDQYEKPFITNDQNPAQKLGYLQYYGRIFICLLVNGKSTSPLVGYDKNDSISIGIIPSTKTTTTTTTMMNVGFPQYPHHALIAGIIGGYTIWGRYTSINYQIVLYLTSRIIVALFQRLTISIQQQNQQSTDSTTKKSSIISYQHFIVDRIYSFSAATVWGIVMYLFEVNPECLHPSLKSSMDEIYRYRSELLPT